MWPNSQFLSTFLVTFTEEIFNGKLYLGIIINRKPSFTGYTWEHCEKIRKYFISICISCSEKEV